MALVVNVVVFVLAIRAVGKAPPGRGLRRAQAGFGAAAIGTGGVGVA